jgi:hypothetical protein
MLFSIIFTAIFLTVNHLYSTLASPMVSNGGGKSLNLTHSLAKRDYVPPDVLCDHAEEWIGRSCLSIMDDRTWMDTCLTDEDDERIYIRIGSCLSDQICMNTFVTVVADEEQNLDNYRTIMCISHPFDEVHRTEEKGLKVQSGVYTIDDGGTGPAEHTVPVSIQDPISAASVSALIEGTY